ncbi:MAG: hypothetical protein KKD73_09525 [Proteobacteria bacterium]|nr:hypothetical protein [Pseudomonadota bacterium]MBU1639410.1 hypothetical protein [Pseudomonadota bacterium]
MKKSTPTKTDRQLAAVHQGALLVSNLKDDESLALRLAEGESWTAQSMHLALLMSGETYINKLLPKNHDEDGSHGRRIRQVTIRRNTFTPEFEPSRHEMRIFDSLDGLVTEM